MKKFMTMTILEFLGNIFKHLAHNVNQSLTGFKHDQSER